jgi:hypothetical protein
VIGMAGPAAGYSSTPLARKLGINAEQTFLLVDAPADWGVPDLPDGVEVRRSTRSRARGPADMVLVFVRRATQLADMQTLGELIFPAGAIWVAWPRKAGGHVSDVAENDIRDAVLPLGLVDVKVAALDNDWSGLKIVWRKELRVRK